MSYDVAVNPDPAPDAQALHRLLSQAFASMEGRIDPPSSMNQLDGADIVIRMASEDLVVAMAGERILGCLFGRVEGQDYLLGKIAVARPARRKGVARAMINAASDHANTLGLRALTLQSRVELTENHAAFHALGFEQTGTYAHPGFDRPTSIVFTRPLSPTPALS